MPISQPAVSQHLAALKAAGLVGERREGRKVFYRIEPAGLTPLIDWLGRYRAFWPERIERLTAGERSVSELRDGLPISQPAVSQHLAALKAAGLVGERREGRKVFYRIEPQGLAPLIDWLGRYRAFWPQKIARLKDVLKEMDQ